LPAATYASTAEEKSRQVKDGREKAYERALAGCEPRYHRYHTELFDGHELSCWERHLLQANSGRLAA